MRYRPRRVLRDIETLDAAIYRAVARAPTPTLDVFMRRLSHAANYSRLSFASAAAISVVYGERGRRAAALGVSSIAATSLTANLLIKPFARRRRPDRVRIAVPVHRHVRMPTTQSFPSGHTAAAFAFATSVGHVLPVAGPPLHALATVVGYSRVHTGVHHPSDTVVGALLGTTVAHGAMHLYDRWSPPERGEASPTALIDAWDQ